MVASDNLRCRQGRVREDPVGLVAEAGSENEEEETVEDARGAEDEKKTNNYQGQQNSNLQPRKIQDANPPFFRAHKRQGGRKNKDHADDDQGYFQRAAPITTQVAMAVASSSRFIKAGRCRCPSGSTLHDYVVRMDDSRNRAEQRGHDIEPETQPQADLEKDTRRG